MRSDGHPLRILYAFDPRRTAILLIGRTRRATIGFTKNMRRWRTTSMTPTSRNSRRRVCISGRSNFSKLVEKMLPERRASVDRLAKDLRAEIDLTQLRTARQLSQAPWAWASTDMYVSTLRRFIEAMGGELEITARFPGRIVRISAKVRRRKIFGPHSEPTSREGSALRFTVMRVRPLKSGAPARVSPQKSRR